MSEPADAVEPKRPPRYKRQNIDLMRSVSDAAVEALSDGEWHRYPDAAKKIAAAIPPGVAKRRYETRMEGRRAAAGTLNPEVVSDTEMINRGRRMIVDDFIRDSVASFEVSYKLKPGRRAANFIDDRKVRMINRPRWIGSAAATTELATERRIPEITVAELRDVLGFDALVRENRALHAEVRKLRELLGEVGSLAARATQGDDD